jgi:hypothetical protein
MCRDVRKFKPEKANFSILFLTIQSVKAYQAVGVNFLPMSASSELEPGPSGLRLVARMVAQGTPGVRRASRDFVMVAEADARGGFTGG